MLEHLNFSKLDGNLKLKTVRLYKAIFDKYNSYISSDVPSYDAVVWVSDMFNVCNATVYKAINKIKQAS